MISNYKKVAAIATLAVGAAIGMVFFNAGTANAKESITMYQDPNCGCCGAWAQYMRDNGFDVKQIKTNQMGLVKDKYSVPHGLESCHTAIIESSNQIIEGHVPMAAIDKLLKNPNIKGVTAPGMPNNSPGMGEMDGNLITLDFDGNHFSKD